MPAGLCSQTFRIIKRLEKLLARGVISSCLGFRQLHKSLAAVVATACGLSKWLRDQGVRINVLGIISAK
jgi:hypothetical protein